MTEGDSDMIAAESSVVNRHARAARIGARIRSHLASQDWSWRYSDTQPADDVDAAALARLRSDRDRASRWLEIASAAIGMPLPVGNGTNGPWHRSAVLDSAGRLGIADIAAGRIAWTDTTVPRYVRRFAVSVGVVTSPHLAGGSGGIGSATEQIALTYGMSGAAQPVLSPLPRPRVTSIEWGLQTCYGTCGSAPTAEEYRPEWARLVAAGVSCCETTAPQWEEIDFGCGVDPALWDRLMPKCRDVRLRGGNWTVGGVRLHYVSVFGTAAARRQRMTEVRDRWRAAIRAEALRVAAGLLDQTGERIRTVSGHRPLDDHGWHPYGQLAIHAALAPADPLSPERRARCNELAARVLAVDPVQHGLSCRSPYGRPGWAYGVNLCRAAYGREFSALTRDEAQEWSSHPYETSLERHILDVPGIVEWERRAREAAEAELARIKRFGAYDPCGPATDEYVATLRAAGYEVTVGQYGRVEATIGVAAREVTS